MIELGKFLKGKGEEVPIDPEAARSALLRWHDETLAPGGTLASDWLRWKLEDEKTAPQTISTLHPWGELPFFSLLKSIPIDMAVGKARLCVDVTRVEHPIPIAVSLGKGNLSMLFVSTPEFPIDLGLYLPDRRSKPASYLGYCEGRLRTAGIVPFDRKFGYAAIQHRREGSCFSIAPEGANDHEKMLLYRKAREFKILMTSQTKDETITIPLRYASCVGPYVDMPQDNRNGHHRITVDEIAEVFSAAYFPHPTAPIAHDASPVGDGEPVPFWSKGKQG